jgi:hypothetical protein
MIWGLVLFVMWTGISGTEQLAVTNEGEASDHDLRRPAVRVLNSEGRIVKEATVWEGTKATITCKVHGFSKQTHLSWTVPSGKTSHDIGHGTKMVFDRITQNNSGLYLCNANDTERRVRLTSSVFLKVEAAPTIHANNVTVVEGRKAILRCSGTNTALPYKFKWLREGKKLEGDANIDNTKHRKVVFRLVNRHHSGMHECRVTLKRQVTISAYPQLTVLCK